MLEDIVFILVTLCASVEYLLLLLAFIHTFMFCNDKLKQKIYFFAETVEAPKIKAYCK